MARHQDHAAQLVAGICAELGGARLTSRSVLQIGEPGRTLRVHGIRGQQARDMAKQIVMDATGDTRYEFDPADTDAVAEAFARFEALTGEGFTAAVRTGGT